VGLLDAILRPNSRLTQDEVPLPSERTTEIGDGLKVTHDAAKQRNIIEADLSAADVLAALALGSAALDMNGQAINNLASISLVKGLELKTAELTTVNATATPIPGFSYAMPVGHAVMLLLAEHGLDPTPNYQGGVRLLKLVNTGSLTTKANDSIGTSVDDIGIGGLTPVLTGTTLTLNYTGKAATVITTRFAWLIFIL
jgi:CBS-domain-containing membrane protein